MRHLTRFFVIAGLIAAAPAVTPAANAQTSSQSPPSFSQPAPSQSAPNIPDQKLDAAAAALRRIASLEQDYRSLLVAAPPADRDRIVKEANGALTKAVTDQGLSVDEYAQIIDEAKNNPEVREKILQRVRPPKEESK